MAKKLLALFVLITYVVGVEAGGRGPPKNKFSKKDVKRGGDDDWDEEQKAHQEDLKKIEAMKRILRLLAVDFSHFSISYRDLSLQKLWPWFSIC